MDNNSKVITAILFLLQSDRHWSCRHKLWSWTVTLADQPLVLHPMSFCSFLASSEPHSPIACSAGLRKQLLMLWGSPEAGQALPAVYWGPFFFFSCQLLMSSVIFHTGSSSSQPEEGLMAQEIWDEVPRGSIIYPQGKLQYRYGKFL